MYSGVLVVGLRSVAVLQTTGFRVYIHGSMSHLLHRFVRHLSVGLPAASHEMAKSYEEAVRTLNTLQSNAAVLEKARQLHALKQLSLPETVQFASRAGISLDDLDKLSAIHVSGTKGKGSTCAFCESILRRHGYKTGFFSSPHLVEVRERIRINGQPLSKQAFSHYFWLCYDKFQSTKAAHNGVMPAYFRFLTIMAFQVFLQEKVDVSIVEVGIGGEYDSTNIIRSPVVVGVTSLDIDHTQLLGNTVEQIAWHKAGIFKPGVPAFTVPQPGDSLGVIADRAQQIGCPLHITPPLDSYDWQDHQCHLGIPGEKQVLNVSLALQLSRIWRRRRSEEKMISQTGVGVSLPEHPHLADAIGVAEPFSITEKEAAGVSTCRWAGRNQVIKKPGISYYLDGAHTPLSLEACLHWFTDTSTQESQRYGGSVARVLVFNCTGDRSPESLLKHLLPCHFDCAVFCPNFASTYSKTADQTNYTVAPQTTQNKCVTNENAWLKLLSDQNIAGERNDIPSVASTRVFANIHDALQWISQGRDPLFGMAANDSGKVPETLVKCRHLQVLCVGSLHLIGGVLGLLQPDMNSSNMLL
ncbi:Folylpolyglutamate synthase, mitochondrial [Lamellibrachia satsuma]|nr:Folylpolyglutamate synthase, mitochondrial [Lamellibrachia satsuma]